MIFVLTLLLDSSPAGGLFQSKHGSFRFRVHRSFFSIDSILSFPHIHSFLDVVVSGKWNQT